jgi:phosphatidylserine/phosphatidylglycerophosphate/cardiolipin synthase-like enzyme
LVQIPDRELHAKFLLWDDDHVVITSLNWSSADTRADAPQAEIGLYLNSTGLAADLRRRFLSDWPALGPPSEQKATRGDPVSPPRRRTREERESKPSSRRRL